MDESDEPNQPAAQEPTQEMAQLMKMLEVQAAARRRQRRAPAAHLLQTQSFRYGSIIAIVVFAFGALGLLEWFLSEMPKPGRGVAKPGVELSIKSEKEAGFGAGGGASKH